MGLWNPGTITIVLCDFYEFIITEFSVFLLFLDFLKFMVIELCSI